MNNMDLLKGLEIWKYNLGNHQYNNVKSTILQYFTVKLLM